jgi:hypothetical protein
MQRCARQERNACSVLNKRVVDRNECNQQKEESLHDSAYPDRTRAE